MESDARVSSCTSYSYTLYSVYLCRTNYALVFHLYRSGAPYQYVLDLFPFFIRSNLWFTIKPCTQTYLICLCMCDTYRCCHHTPRSLSPTWRSERDPGWHGSGRRSPGKGWCNMSPDYLRLGASTWSECAVHPRRWRWTAPHWLKCCVRGQIWLLRLKRAVRKLEILRKRCQSCMKNASVLSVSDYINANNIVFEIYYQRGWKEILLTL